jgi:hypothetical protein
MAASFFCGPMLRIGLQFCCDSRGPALITYFTTSNQTYYIPVPVFLWSEDNTGLLSGIGSPLWWHSTGLKISKSLMIDCIFPTGTVNTGAKSAELGTSDTSTGIDISIFDTYRIQKKGSKYRTLKVSESVLRSWSRKKPHLLAGAGAVTRCGSGSDNGIKYG